LHCFVIFKARLKYGVIGNILTREYNTVKGVYDSGEMFDAKDGFYLSI
jgi:hypothetical protein